jgi:ubiquinone/menaquinone biosynthesis C-methylase UbiE
MNMTTSRIRWIQLASIATVAIFAMGFFYAPLGVWTGAILSAWFIGTQKAWRGFLWISGFALIAHLSAIWRAASLGMAHAGWAILALFIGALPYLLYRVTIQRRRGFPATLSLPLWGAALQMLGVHIPGPQVLAGANGIVLVFIYWTASALNWMWGQEFRRAKIAAGASIYAAACSAALGYGFLLSHRLAFPSPAADSILAWASLAGGLILTAWAFLRPDTIRMPWANKTDTVAFLRSPHTRAPLHVESNNNEEALVSGAGERFPIRDGIPEFVKPETITGSNRKFHRMYETIGGFYDDTQRVGSALMGIDRDEVFLSYLRLLETKPGDTVLETSVGTGLNFKYLPQGVKLFGLDLSSGMLASCQANLHRWELDADLFLGNAEELPFADNSFDVVFHSGGINFFNDRAKAIGEMIRVAKPGSRILIADETEEYVKSSYERNPITRGNVKDRQEAVSAPVDLVPPEMQEVKVESVWAGKFYALTFRKPSFTTTNLRPK